MPFINKPEAVKTNPSEESSSVIPFSCNRCGHSASINDIDEKRRMVAEEMEKELGSKITVSSVNKGDIVSCPECDGQMKCPQAMGRTLYAKVEESIRISGVKELAKGLELTTEPSSYGLPVLTVRDNNDIGIPAGIFSPGDFVKTHGKLSSIAEILIDLAKQHRWKGNDLSMVKRYLSQWKDGPKLN
jgi:hypothetical protein